MSRNILNYVHPFANGWNNFLLYQAANSTPKDIKIVIWFDFVDKVRVCPFQCIACLKLPSPVFMNEKQNQNNRKEGQMAAAQYSYCLTSDGFQHPPYILVQWDENRFFFYIQSISTKMVAYPSTSILLQRLSTSYVQKGIPDKQSSSFVCISWILCFGK